ncbi:hypothetical protein DV515_00008963 [Chloebia gouldiae]|uniref:Ectonucleoside triphosphate diphosphohydrolase 8 n=1 Tax=Chloebia gouldiae TaxID=44316 RepID=A0A3L8SDH7_CHLGU|nr:hypothetical protein DV515_00008963 [Chloebia gouldiae]
MGSKAKAIAGLLAATCVCSIIALILSVVNVKDVLLPPSTKYGLVFDAGSTHTSLYIYRWPADKENDTGIVSQVEACPAFAGFYYTFSFLNLTHQQSLGEVNTTVLSFCRRNWAELVQSFPQDLKYLHTYCSMAFYILTLLLDGYKFNEHTWSNIHFRRQAANTDIGWTLGFMLNVTNMIPAEVLQHVKGHQPGLWAGAVSFLVLAIMAGLVAVFLHCFWKTK